MKHNIENPASTILFVGYQAEGTFGRRLLDGAQKVKLFGKEYAVRAQIVRMDGMSGHGDQKVLLDWIHGFTDKQPQQVFVVHGEDETTTAFAEILSRQHGFKAMAPYSGTVYDLIRGSFIRIARPKRIAGSSAEAVRGASDSYTKLQIAAKRLETLIGAQKGRPNKELEILTREINNLCRKYE